MLTYVFSFYESSSTKDINIKIESKNEILGFELVFTCAENVFIPSIDFYWAPNM